MQSHPNSIFTQFCGQSYPYLSPQIKQKHNLNDVLMSNTVCHFRHISIGYLPDDKFCNLPKQNLSAKTISPISLIFSKIFARYQRYLYRCRQNYQPLLFGVQTYHPSILNQLFIVINPLACVGPPVCTQLLCLLL